MGLIILSTSGTYTEDVGLSTSGTYTEDVGLIILSIYLWYVHRGCGVNNIIYIPLVRTQRMWGYLPLVRTQRMWG